MILKISLDDSRLYTEDNIIEVFKEATLDGNLPIMIICCCFRWSLPLITIYIK